MLIVRKSSGTIIVQLSTYMIVTNIPAALTQNHIHIDWKRHNIEYLLLVYLYTVLHTRSFLPPPPPTLTYNTSDREQI